MPVAEGKPSRERLAIEQIAEYLQRTHRTIHAYGDSAEARAMKALVDVIIKDIGHIITRASTLDDAAAA